MSAATKVALDAALAAHIADETRDGMVTSYVAIAEYTRLDLIDGGYSAFVRLGSENLGITESLGLWHYGLLRTEKTLSDGFMEDDD